MTIVDPHDAIEHRSALSTVLDALPMELCAWDRALRLRYANAAARANLFLNPVIGGTAHELVGENLLNHLLPYVQAALEGHTRRYEWTSTRAGEGRFTYVVELAPVVVDGAVVGVRSLGAEIHGAADIRARTRLIIERDHVGERLDTLVQPRLRAVVQALAVLPRNVERCAPGALERIGTDLHAAVNDLRAVIGELRVPPEVPAIVRQVPAVPSRPAVEPPGAPVPVVQQQEQVRVQIAEPPGAERRWGVAFERALFEALPAAETWDERTCAVVLNDRALASFGWPAGTDVAGRAYRDLAGDALAEINEPALRSALAGQAVSGRLDFLGADGVSNKGLQRYAPAVYGCSTWAVGVRLDVGDLLDGADGADEHQLATELAADRARMAEDLHDHVIQLLYAAGLSLTTLADDANADVPVLLSNAVQCVAEAILSLDSTAGVLRRGHVVRPRELLARITRRSAGGLGFAPRVDLVGDPNALPDDLVDDLAAVLREALSNVARHAHARHAHVLVSSTERELRLQVTDDGVGIGRVDRASGLANMAARAERRAGTFETRNADPSGTTVDWRVPL